MLRAWAPIARAVKAWGGFIAWEWPRCCRLWSHPKVQAVLQEFDLDSAYFDGRAFGPKCSSGKHIGLPF